MTPARIAKAQQLVRSLSTNAALEYLGLAKRPAGAYRRDIIGPDGSVLLASASAGETTAWILAGCREPDSWIAAGFRS